MSCKKMGIRGFLLVSLSCFMVYTFLLSRIDIAPNAPPLVVQIVGIPSCRSRRGVTDVRLTNIPLLNQLLLRKALRTMVVIGRSGGHHFGFMAVTAGVTVYTIEHPVRIAENSEDAAKGGGIAHHRSFAKDFIGDAKDFENNKIFIEDAKISSKDFENTAALGGVGGVGSIIGVDPRHLVSPKAPTKGRWIFNKLPQKRIDMLLIQEWDDFEQIIEQCLRRTPPPTHVVVLNVNRGQCMQFVEFLVSIGRVCTIAEELPLAVCRTKLTDLGSLADLGSASK